MKKITSILAILLSFSLHGAAGQLDDTNAEETVASGVSIVYFYANWCGYCSRFAPRFAEFNKQLENSGINAKAYKANVDNAEKFKRKHNVRAIPVVLAFKDGKEVERVTGSQTTVDQIWYMTHRTIAAQ